MRRLFLLPSQVVRLASRLRSEHLPNETGGFLIGIRRGIHVEVTGLTEQGPGDLATGVSFERLCPTHRERIHAVWRASDHYESLVGDWHSHPWGLGAASATDRSAWRTLAKASKRPMIGLIVTEGHVPRLFLAVRSGLRTVRELTIIERTEDLLIFTKP